MDNNEKSPVVSPIELPILLYIRQKYEPARMDDEGLIMLTTIDLLQKICSHTGDSTITLEYLYTWLKTNSYKEEAIGDLDFVWCLKEINW